MNAGLLSALLVLQGLTLAGVAWLWWRDRQAGSQSERQRLEDDCRREVRGLERYIESKVDLLLAQILSQRTPPIDFRELASALRPVKEEPAPKEGPPQKSAPVPEEPEPLNLASLPQAPQREEVSWGAERRLAKVLDTSVFLQDVWPDMDGPFEEAKEKFTDHFTELGIPEPHIEAHPPIESGGSNHWLFLVVSYRDPQATGRRFLIPRNYSRYDPLVHDHLFDVRGAGGSADYFIRELRQCALLEEAGELKGFIQNDLVFKKGEMVV